MTHFHRMIKFHQSCKKHISLTKHINSKHKDHKCKECHFSFNNTMDLLKHIAEDHNTAVKVNNTENKENKEDKKVEQEACDNWKDDNSRCSKCGYILFTENTYEVQGQPKIFCKLCPILKQQQG